MSPETCSPESWEGSLPDLIVLPVLGTVCHCSTSGPLSFCSSALHFEIQPFLPTTLSVPIFQSGISVSSLLPSLVTRPTWIIRPQMIMLRHMQMALCSVQSIFMAIISLSASQLIWEAVMITPILQKKN